MGIEKLAFEDYNTNFMGWKIENYRYLYVGET